MAEGIQAFRPRKGGRTWMGNKKGRRGKASAFGLYGIKLDFSYVRYLKPDTGLSGKRIYLRGIPLIPLNPPIDGADEAGC